MHSDALDLFCMYRLCMYRVASGEHHRTLAKSFLLAVLTAQNAIANRPGVRAAVTDSKHGEGVSYTAVYSEHRPWNVKQKSEIIT